MAAFPLFGLRHIAEPTRACTCRFCRAAEDCLVEEDEYSLAIPVSFASLSNLQLNRPNRPVSPIFPWVPLITTCSEQAAILPHGLRISFFRGCRKQDTGLFAASGHAVSCQIKLSECNFRRRKKEMPRPRGNIAGCSVQVVCRGAQVNIGLTDRVNLLS